MAVLPVALAQLASGLDPGENRDRVAAMLAGLPGGLRGGLVVLPEATARDFGPPGSPLGEHAEPLDGPFVGMLTQAARAQGATVVAGMFERGDDPDRPWNTLVVVDGDGLRASYRKIHLYDSFGYRESDVLTAGPVEPVVVPVGGVGVGLMTCYDLRFPELARALTAAGAELLVVPAAWVAGPRKATHWRTLLTARAVEDLVYVAGAGQPGPRYTGHSLVVDPRGDLLATAPEGDPAADGVWVRAVVDTAEVAAARRENPSLDNRRF